LKIIVNTIEKQASSWNCKPRPTLCVFSHAYIETTSSKGVHCTRWENIRTCRSAFSTQLRIASVVIT